MTWTITAESRDGYTVSSDPARLDVDAMHAYLTRCYWSPGIPREVVARAAAGSLCFGLYCGAAQVGLARMITDGATFAYLCDVYVLEEHRGHGRGRWLMECEMRHPQLQGLRRMALITRDAHGLYAPLGFAPLRTPEGWMEVHVPNAYGAPAAEQAPAPHPPAVL